MKSGLFFVSPNGLGHFKRVTTWIPYLLDSLPQYQFHVACEEWQLSRVMSEPWMQRLKQSPRVTFHMGKTKGAPKWYRNPEAYTDLDLLVWRNPIKRWSLFHQADFVVSDNMTELLKWRSDIILMGSFLWGEVLKDQYGGIAGVEAYAQEEAALLSKHQPSMLCVHEIAMPSVVQKTQNVGLPWFTTSKETALVTDQPKKQVVFLGGATPAISDELVAVAQRLAQEHPWDIYVPPHLRSPNDGLHTFNFSSRAWSQLSVVVCRPGIGTLTDAIHYGVPLVAITEPENAEMRHNAARIQSLGMGEAVSLTDIEALGTAIKQLLEKDRHAQVRQSLRSRPTGGYAAATRWLQERVG